MEKNGLGARNPSVRLVWHESKFCGNKRPKCEVICPGVGRGYRRLDQKLFLVSDRAENRRIRSNSSELSDLP